MGDLTDFFAQWRQGRLGDGFSDCDKFELGDVGLLGAGGWGS